MNGNALNLIENLIIDDVPVDLSVYQGKTYILGISYSGDISNGIFRGQIRNKYLQDSGSLLADFEFESISYDDIEDKTTFNIILSATNTSMIPYTKFQGVGEPTTKNCHVYDIEYEENGVVLQILRGLVEVKPEVTE